MNRSTSRQRQITYLVGILILMGPIIYLGMPTTQQTGAGIIAQKRLEYELGEPSLGNVDPASATMNLVLLGLRGVAANLLWMEADHLKDTKNWSQLKTTVESIILLQPHFQSVWKFQAWNLGFNVSAECDAVPDRYYWVKEGIKFLRRGTERNQKVPELFHDMGDYYGKKIGRSDEKVLFRKYFHFQDPDTVKWPNGPDEDVNPNRLDNYLVAKEWYAIANEKVARDGIEQHKMAWPIFANYPYRSQMDYASIRQDEGQFGDTTREAWATGYREWTEEYGRTDFATPGGMVRFEADETELAKISEEDQVPLDVKMHWLDRYQKMVNYRYWRLRCDVERNADMAAARGDLALGRRAYREGDLDQAKELLYNSLEKFQTVVDEYRLADGRSQLLSDEGELAEGIIKGILIWQHVLSLRGDEVPTEFPMDELWTDAEWENKRAELQHEFIRWQGGSLATGAE